MNIEERMQYITFMYNPDNAGNCAECPMNAGIQRGGAYIAGPCGQQNCWVDVHCAAQQEQEGE